MTREFANCLKNAGLGMVMRMCGLSCADFGAIRKRPIATVAPGISATERNRGHEGVTLNGQ